jgi:hypothetical protein
MVSLILFDGIFYGLLALIFVATDDDYDDDDDGVFIIARTLQG